MFFDNFIEGKTNIFEKDIRSSYVGFVVDDLVSAGDEGRGKPR